MAATNPGAPVRSAQKIVDVLSAQGVEYVFGIPGAKVDAVFDALVDGGPQVVVCRHEQNAAFMAGAIGRLTGTPGVVLVTSGPGTTNLATGLLTANTEQDPVVALCGAVTREDRLKRTHQSMDAAAMLKTVTKYTGEINDPDNAAEAVIGAFRAAVSEPRGAAAAPRGRPRNTARRRPGRPHDGGHHCAAADPTLGGRPGGGDRQRERADPRREQGGAAGRHPRR